MPAREAERHLRAHPCHLCTFRAEVYQVIVRDTDTGTLHRHTTEAREPPPHAGRESRKMAAQGGYPRAAAYASSSRVKATSTQVPGANSLARWARFHALSTRVRPFCRTVIRRCFSFITAGGAATSTPSAANSGGGLP